MNGIQEVVGSIPIGSTILPFRKLKDTKAALRGGFSHSGISFQSRLKNLAVRPLPSWQPKDGAVLRKTGAPRDMRLEATSGGLRGRWSALARVGHSYA